MVPNYLKKIPYNLNEFSDKMLISVTRRTV